MPIQFKCPNGHELRVPDKYAGQAGLCPRCQVRVLVPHAAQSLDDQAIMDLLGPPPAPVTASAGVTESSEGLQQLDPNLVKKAVATGSGLRGALNMTRGTKVCPKCRQEIRLSYDICPFCRTYFTDVTEISRRVTPTCKSCGAETKYGDTACPKCGKKIKPS